ncbi:MAG: hypothetical protein KAY37_08560 [Phycisphaerae bacterium]|nr:hypothetical protein [Phycisphaerae bacterium]
MKPKHTRGLLAISGGPLIVLAFVALPTGTAEAQSERNYLNLTTDSEHMNGFYGNYAVWREEIITSIPNAIWYHLIYDEAVEVQARQPWQGHELYDWRDPNPPVMRAAYRLMYRLIKVPPTGSPILYEPVVLKEGAAPDTHEGRCYEPWSPSVVKDNSGHLHVTGVRYWCPNVPAVCTPDGNCDPETQEFKDYNNFRRYVDHSELWHFRIELNPGSGGATVVEEHTLHLEKLPNSTVQPYPYPYPDVFVPSEKIIGPADILYLAPDIYVLFSQRADLGASEDVHDHDIFCRRGVQQPNGTVLWLSVQLVTDPGIPTTDDPSEDPYDAVRPRILEREVLLNRQLCVAFQRKERSGNACDIRSTFSNDNGATWQLLPDGDGYAVTPEGSDGQGHLCPRIEKGPQNDLYVCCRSGRYWGLGQIRVFKSPASSQPQWEEASYSPLLSPCAEAAKADLLPAYYSGYPSFRVWGTDTFSVVYEAHDGRLSHPNVVKLLTHNPTGVHANTTRTLYSGGWGTGKAARWVLHYDNYTPMKPYRTAEVFWCRKIEPSADSADSAAADILRLRVNYKTSNPTSPRHKAP